MLRVPKTKTGFRFLDYIFGLKYFHNTLRGLKIQTKTYAIKASTPPHNKSCRRINARQNMTNGVSSSY